MLDNETAGVGWEYSASANDYPEDGRNTPPPAQTDIEGWMLYAAPASQDEEMEPVGCRVSARTLRHLDEMVIDLKSLGHPVKTRSDLIRIAVVKTLSDLASWIGEGHESAHAWRVGQRHIAQQAESMESVMAARGSVAKMVSGLGYVTSGHAEYTEAMERVDKFLSPIMGSLSVDHPFLSRVYLKELFRNAEFRGVLETIRQNVGSTAIIDNAERAYNRITGESA